MSHAFGVASFKGEYRWFEFDATNYVVYPRLRSSRKALLKHWRNPPPAAPCSCGREEEVELFTYADGGLSWKGTACRYCSAIAEGLKPSEDAFAGKAEWVKDFEAWEQRRRFDDPLVLSILLILSSGVMLGIGWVMERFFGQTFFHGTEFRAGIWTIAVMPLAGLLWTGPKLIDEFVKYRMWQRRQGRGGGE